MVRSFLVVLGLALGLVLGSAVVAPRAAHAQVKIVIDPGHGGSDPGGVGTGLQEKNVVLDVSKRFKALLDADTADDKGGGKWTALMTRSTDVFVSLAGRSAYSNNQDADRFMSIHANAFSDPGANGTETFSLTNGTTGAALRNLVQAEMIAAWGLTNRGNKTANFAVLRDTAAPAELHELAFITNARDAAKLGSATERQKAAVAHLRAIQRHYNLAPYLPGATPPPPTDATGELAGRVIDDLGPVVGAEVAIEGGARVLTDADGAFVFSEVPAGTVNLTASAENHEDKQVTVDIVAAARAELEIELVRATDGEPDPTAKEVGGGCNTGGGAAGGALLVLALGFLAMRRRR